MLGRLPSALLFLAACTVSAAAAEPTEKKPAPPVPPELAAAVEKLNLPGVRINLEQWCVDVDSTVCLRQGLLELIATTKDARVHESIIAVDAKPSHIHAALLLLGAKAGTPATRKPINPEATRLIDIPPTGAPVEVSLVVPGPDGKPAEHTISEFISPADHDENPSPSGNEEPEAEKKFPTNTFLFAGSILIDAEEGPRKYLCDSVGNVISISTFGDEVLCLPGIHGHENAGLNWQVNAEKLPPLDSKVTLRLRPQRPKPTPAAE